MKLAYENVDHDTKALLQIDLNPMKDLLYANNATFAICEEVRQTAERYTTITVYRTQHF